MKAFRRIYEALSRQEVNSGFIEQKLELLGMEIEKLDASYREAEKKRQTAAYSGRITLTGESKYDGNMASSMGAPGLGSIRIGGSGEVYAKLAEDLKRRLEEKRTEYANLLEERSMSVKAKTSFEAFLKTLNGLPVTNMAGQPLRVNTLDAVCLPSRALFCVCF